MANWKLMIDFYDFLEPKDLMYGDFKEDESPMVLFRDLLFKVKNIDYDEKIIEPETEEGNVKHEVIGYKDAERKVLKIQPL